MSDHELDNKPYWQSLHAEEERRVFEDIKLGQQPTKWMKVFDFVDPVEWRQAKINLLLNSAMLIFCTCTLTIIVLNVF